MTTTITSLKDALIALEMTRRGSIRIKYAQEQWATDPLRSHLRGEPYWEAETDHVYPALEGRPLRLLLQVNWEQVHQEVGDAGLNFTRLRLPRMGITQIFMDDLDPSHGYHDDGGFVREGWTILHWPDACAKRYAAPGIELAPLGEGEERFPIKEPIGICFAAESMVCGPSDALDFPMIGELPDEVANEIDEKLLNAGSRIGGYAELIGDDPRMEEGVPHFKMLFQLDSLSPMEWGESGVANWFIDPVALAKLDFSDVLFHWEF